MGITDLSPIGNKEKLGIPQKAGTFVNHFFSYDWIFTGWEKWVVGISILWTLYSIMSFVWGLFA